MPLKRTKAMRLSRSRLKSKKRRVRGDKLDTVELCDDGFTTDEEEEEDDQYEICKHVEIQQTAVHHENVGNVRNRKRQRTTKQSKNKINIDEHKSEVQKNSEESLVPAKKKKQMQEKEQYTVSAKQDNKTKKVAKKKRAKISDKHGLGEVEVHESTESTVKETLGNIKRNKRKIKTGNMDEVEYLDDEHVEAKKVKEHIGKTENVSQTKKGRQPKVKAENVQDKKVGLHPNCKPVENVTKSQVKEIKRKNLKIDDKTVNKQSDAKTEIIENFSGTTKKGIQPKVKNEKVTDIDTHPGSSKSAESVKSSQVKDKKMKDTKKDDKTVKAQNETQKTGKIDTFSHASKGKAKKVKDITEDTHSESGKTVESVPSNQAMEKNKKDAKTGDKTAKAHSDTKKSRKTEIVSHSTKKEKQSKVKTEADKQVDRNPENITASQVKEKKRKEQNASEKISQGKQKKANNNSSELLQREPLPGTSMKYVGAHVSIVGGLFKSVLEAVAMKANAFGLFLKSQRQWNSKPLEDDVAIKFKETCKEYGFLPQFILPHGSYLMNCGSPDENILQKSRDSLVDELQRCEKLGLTLFNFHPGSTCGKISIDKCLDTIAESIDIAHSKTKGVITVIENMSCQGHTIGGKFQELRGIIDRVKDKSRMGICLDTCHAFAAGYDISTESGFNEMMSDFDTIIGFQYLKAMHLNDSDGEVGCHRDRHENIGKGHIGKEGFKRIMNHPKLDNIPMILETPCPSDNTYTKEVQMLYSMCNQ